MADNDQQAGSAEGGTQHWFLSPLLSSFLFSLSSRLFSALGPRTSALFFSHCSYALRTRFSLSPESCAPLEGV
jgi:hypothetical protein